MSLINGKVKSLSAAEVWGEEAAYLDPQRMR